MMPFVADNKDEILQQKLLQMPEFKGESPKTIDLAMSIFRTENSIGSLVSKTPNLPDSIIENADYNPWDNLTDSEKLDEQFLSNAIRADNPQELQAVRSQSERERKDRSIIAKGGAMSFALGFGVGGLADPINLIPIGGTALKTYKTGESIFRSGMAVGSVAAASSSMQETALHASQIERTFGESAVNVSASFFLSGLFGVGVSKLSNFGVTPKTIKEINDTFDVEVKQREGIDSVGAARVLDDVKVKGKFARFLTKTFGFDPLSRTITSKSSATRKIANFLAENPIEMEGGRTLSSVESLAKIHDGKYVQALTAHLNEYSKYKQGGGKLKQKEFSELVSSAVRSGKSDIPEVLSAAKAWDKELYEPLKNLMIEGKLLPEDVDVKTAKNYLNRVWNKQKVAAKLDEFVKKTAKWLEEEDIKSFKNLDSLESSLSKAKTKAEIKDIESQIRRIKKKESLDFEKQDYESVARQIAQRIKGTPDGRLPYDWKLGSGSTGFNVAGIKSLRGPLKKRVFNIPDKLVEDFLENDIQKLGARYLRQTAADIELNKAFDGDIEMKSALKEIDDWWSNAIIKEKNVKKRLKMEKQKDSDINDISAMRDRIRGTFGQVEHNNPWVRAGRAIRDLNYLRFMGGVVASSIPDVARVFMAEGFVKTFKNGLKPLVSNLRKFKIAASEAKRYGVGVDVLMGGRSEIIADVADYSQGGTAVERLLRGAADKFGKINLMDQWTSGMKQLHAVTMQTSIIEELMKGKIDKRLSRLGISDDEARLIAKEVKNHGKKIEGVWLSGAKNWDDADLERAWGAAIRKESDRVIVMPGQEKPLFMSSELGKAIFQFRTFMFSSTQRMLIAGVQGQDSNFMGGLLMLTTMGSMAYAFKQWDAGREISADPRVLVTEGIDRSGTLGMLMEINNTVEKISNNNFGLRPLIGASQPSSRFASRSQLEGLLGPTFGSFGETTLKVLSAGTQDREWKDADTRALRRLLPYQNLMIVRQAFDKIEKLTGQ